MSKVEELRENISKSREELKSVFDAPAEDGKYSADQKWKKLPICRVIIVGNAYFFAKKRASMFEQTPALIQQYIEIYIRQKQP